MTASLGIVSDTHGLVRREALAALRGVELIVHAGDVGDADVLAALETVAPVLAVRGNNDHGAWARRLPLRRTFEAGGARVHVVHERGDLTGAALRARPAMIVTGHSHRPSAVIEKGILFLNPGSAGPRRFRLPISLARCEISDGRVSARLIDLGSPEVSEAASAADRGTIR